VKFGLASDWGFETGSFDIILAITAQVGCAILTTKNYSGPPPFSVPYPNQG